MGSGVVVARSATKRNFPDESITIGPGTTAGLTHLSSCTDAGSTQGALLTPKIATVSALNGTDFPQESCSRRNRPLALRYRSYCPDTKYLEFRIT